MRSQLVLTCAFVACALVVLSNGCNEPAKEGDPCNALIAHDECTEGTCQIIGSCTVGHCCPADPSTSKNPYCNGMSCPPLPEDGGDDGSATEAGADATTEAAPEAAAEAAVEAAVEAASETSTSDAPSESSADAGGG